MTFLRKLLQKRGGLLLKVAGGLILGGIVLGGGGLIYCGIMSHTARELPKPGGPYAIGRTVFDWVDQARPETFAHKPGVKRELMVWVWYPAQSGASKEAASYLPSKWAQAWNQYHGGSLFGDWLISRAETIHAHAFENVPLATNQARYPVLIFSPGMGLLPTDYTTLIEDLVSHGYIVVGIAPTYSASAVVFSDGRVVQATEEGKGGNDSDPADVINAHLQQIEKIWAADTIFVMNQLEHLNSVGQSLLAGRLDLERLGLFGHSFGGATAAEVCHLDERCKAGIDLDGNLFGNVVQQGLTKPFLFMHHGTIDDCNDCKDLFTQARSVLRTVPTGEKYILGVEGMKHMNFSDFSVMFSPFKLMGILGPIDGARGLSITSAYVRAFFDTYLNQKPSPLLRGPASAYPEVRFDQL
ncbi:alpha/beta hydrolase family protein [Ktedonobacter racemifer]|uniref:Platelet-activating factor acetylhydrolase plasma/intracellular isoform II n=1 Tax=Ktedonobacter racemifer DSM 44963 TaxID=485913 RepID=D6TZZ4_KTERA|nr:Platelet-activating factor acetylhydrolase plasma/intracellular isoform II [Ktedonobacter racemifer]EFH82134.1 Platelet-activating factor acetylhydrolase plasma/intracellular isoform II [Ktedonobacter racemifer DSM 44963]